MVGDGYAESSTSNEALNYMETGDTVILDIDMDEEIHGI